MLRNSMHPLPTGRFRRVFIVMIHGKRKKQLSVPCMNNCQARLKSIGRKLRLNETL